MSYQNYDWDAFRIKNGWPPVGPITLGYVGSIVERIDTVKRTPRWGACLRIKDAPFDPRAVLWWDVADGKKIALPDAEIILECLKKRRNIGVSFWRLSEAVGWLSAMHEPTRCNEDQA